MLLVLLSIAFTFVWGAGVYALRETLKVRVDDKRYSHFPVKILKGNMPRVSIFVYWHFHINFFIIGAVFKMFLQ